MSEEIKPDVINASDVVENAAAAAEDIHETVSQVSEEKAEEKVEEAPVAQEPQTEEEKPDPQTEEESPAPQAEEEPSANVGEPAQEPVENEAADSQEPKEETVNYSEKTLAELTSLFQALMSDEDRMKKSKNAEAIKSAFYTKISIEKAQAGITEEPAQDEETPQEPKENPFAVIEDGFKSLYSAFRKERAEYNKRQDEERESNLVKKQAIIEGLKNLVENASDMGTAFPQFRDFQSKWRETGPVPVKNFRDINDTYQFYVEKFYDKVQLNRDMRDLDFKKNLEAKEKFCEVAEELARNENVVEAFRELQKLHEQWKEFGPVAKEFRESIWERFKAATAVINRKYQAHFEEFRAKQAENFSAKTALCEKTEEIAARENLKSSNDWNIASKEITDIQAEWRKIGFASKKDNQKLYDRFRAACDKFFERKRVFYTDFKDSMHENLDKKMSLIEQAEALKTSTEWKKATDQFIALQKQWKEIGAVPRKKSEQLWKRFRAACDEFFAQRDQNSKPENDYYGNLKAKKALIEEINAFNSEDAQLLRDAAQSFSERWQAIGFVPFKDKEAVTAAYKEAMQAKFPDFGSYRSGSRPRPAGAPRGNVSRAPMSEKDKLVHKYNQLQQDIDTYENNIGFFAASKNSAPLIRQMEEKIDSCKKELKELEAQIRSLETAAE